MLLQSDRSQFENVRFIGNIGTLYIKSSSEIDQGPFLLSRLLHRRRSGLHRRPRHRGLRSREIKYVASRMPTGGNIGYPSTLVFNGYGFLFDSCNFTAETGASGVTLGRQWLEESDTVSLRGLSVGKMIVRNSTLGAHLAGAAPWSLTGARMTTPKNPDVDAGRRSVWSTHRMITSRRASARRRPSRTSASTAIRAPARTSSPAAAQIGAGRNRLTFKKDRPPTWKGFRGNSGRAMSLRGAGRRLFRCARIHTAPHRHPGGITDVEP